MKNANGGGVVSVCSCHRTSTIPACRGKYTFRKCSFFLFVYGSGDPLQLV